MTNPLSFFNRSTSDSISINDLYGRIRSELYFQQMLRWRKEYVDDSGKALVQKELSASELVGQTQAKSLSFSKMRVVQSHVLKHQRFSNYLSMKEGFERALLEECLSEQYEDAFYAEANESESNYCAYLIHMDTHIRMLPWKSLQADYGIYGDVSKLVSTNNRIDWASSIEKIDKFITKREINGLSIQEIGLCASNMRDPIDSGELKYKLFERLGNKYKDIMSLSNAATLYEYVRCLSDEYCSQRNIAKYQLLDALANDLLMLQSGYVASQTTPIDRNRRLEHKAETNSYILSEEEISELDDVLEEIATSRKPNRSEEIFAMVYDLQNNYRQKKAQMKDFMEPKQREVLEREVRKIQLKIQYISSNQIYSLEARRDRHSINMISMDNDVRKNLLDLINSSKEKYIKKNDPYELKAYQIYVELYLHQFGNFDRYDKTLINDAEGIVISPSERKKILKEWTAVAFEAYPFRERVDQRWRNIKLEYCRSTSGSCEEEHIVLCANKLRKNIDVFMRLKLSKSSVDTLRVQEKICRDQAIFFYQRLRLYEKRHGGLSTSLIKIKRIVDGFDVVTVDDITFKGFLLGILDDLAGKRDKYSQYSEEKYYSVEFLGAEIKSQEDERERCLLESISYLNDEVAKYVGNYGAIKEMDFNEMYIVSSSTSLAKSYIKRLKSNAKRDVKYLKEKERNLKYLKKEINKAKAKLDKLREKIKRRVDEDVTREKVGVSTGKLKRDLQKLEREKIQVEDNLRNLNEELVFCETDLLTANKLDELGKTLDSESETLIAQMLIAVRNHTQKIEYDDQHSIIQGRVDLFVLHVQKSKDHEDIQALLNWYKLPTSDRLEAMRDDLKNICAKMSEELLQLICMQMINTGLPKMVFSLDSDRLNSNDKKVIIKRMRSEMFNLMTVDMEKLSTFSNTGQAIRIIPSAQSGENELFSQLNSHEVYDGLKLTSSVRGSQEQAVLSMTLLDVVGESHVFEQDKANSSIVSKYIKKFDEQLNIGFANLDERSVKERGSKIYNHKKPLHYIINYVLNHGDDARINELMTMLNETAPIKLKYSKAHKIFMPEALDLPGESIVSENSEIFVVCDNVAHMLAEINLKLTYISKLNQALLANRCDLKNLEDNGELTKILKMAEEVEKDFDTLEQYLQGLSKVAWYKKFTSKHTVFENNLKKIRLSVLSSKQNCSNQLVQLAESMQENLKQRFRSIELASGENRLLSHETLLRLKEYITQKLPLDKQAKLSAIDRFNYNLTRLVNPAYNQYLDNLETIVSDNTALFSTINELRSVNLSFLSTDEKARDDFMRWLNGEQISEDDLHDELKPIVDIIKKSVGFKGHGSDYEVVLKLYITKLKEMFSSLKYAGERDTSYQLMRLFMKDEELSKIKKSDETSFSDNVVSSVIYFKQKKLFIAMHRKLLNISFSHRLNREHIRTFQDWLNNDTVDLPADVSDDIKSFKQFVYDSLGNSEGIDVNENLFRKAMKHIATMPKARHGSGYNMMLELIGAQDSNSTITFLSDGARLNESTLVNMVDASIKYADNTAEEQALAIFRQLFVERNINYDTYQKEMFKQWFRGSESVDTSIFSPTQKALVDAAEKLHAHDGIESREGSRDCINNIAQIYKNWVLYQPDDNLHKLLELILPEHEYDTLVEERKAKLRSQLSNYKITYQQTKQLHEAHAVDKTQDEILQQLKPDLLDLIVVCTNDYYKKLMSQSYNKESMSKLQRTYISACRHKLNEIFPVIFDDDGVDRNEAQRNALQKLFARELNFRQNIIALIAYQHPEGDEVIYGIVEYIKTDVEGEEYDGSDDRFLYLVDILSQSKSDKLREAYQSLLDAIIIKKIDYSINNNKDLKLLLEPYQKHIFSSLSALGLIRAHCAGDTNKNYNILELYGGVDHKIQQIRNQFALILSHFEPIKNDSRFADRKQLLAALNKYSSSDLIEILKKYFAINSKESTSFYPKIVKLLTDNISSIFNPKEDHFILSLDDLTLRRASILIDTMLETLHELYISQLDEDMTKCIKRYVTVALTSKTLKSEQKAYQDCRGILKKLSKFEFGDKYLDELLSINEGGLVVSDEQEFDSLCNDFLSYDLLCERYNRRITKVFKKGFDSLKNGVDGLYRTYARISHAVKTTAISDKILVYFKDNKDRVAELYDWVLKSPYVNRTCRLTLLKERYKDSRYQDNNIYLIHNELEEHLKLLPEAEHQLFKEELTSWMYAQVGTIQDEPQNLLDLNSFFPPYEGMVYSVNIYVKLHDLLAKSSIDDIIDSIDCNIMDIQNELIPESFDEDVFSEKLNGFYDAIRKSSEIYGFSAEVVMVYLCENISGRPKKLQDKLLDYQLTLLMSHFANPSKFESLLYDNALEASMDAVTSYLNNSEILDQDKIHALNTLLKNIQQYISLGVFTDKSYKIVLPFCQSLIINAKILIDIKKENKLNPSEHDLMRSCIQCDRMLSQVSRDLHLTSGVDDLGESFLEKYKGVYDFRRQNTFQSYLKKANEYLDKIDVGDITLPGFLLTLIEDINANVNSKNHSEYEGIISELENRIEEMKSQISTTATAMIESEKKTTSMLDCVHKILVHKSNYTERNDLRELYDSFTEYICGKQLDLSEKLVGLMTNRNQINMLRLSLSRKDKVSIHQTLSEIIASSSLSRTENSIFFDYLSILQDFLHPDANRLDTKESNELLEQLIFLAGSEPFRQQSKLNGLLKQSIQCLSIVELDELSVNYEKAVDMGVEGLALDPRPIDEEDLIEQLDKINQPITLTKIAKILSIHFGSDDYYLYFRIVNYCIDKSYFKIIDLMYKEDLDINAIDKFKKDHEKKEAKKEIKILHERVEKAKEKYSNILKRFQFYQESKSELESKQTSDINLLLSAGFTKCIDISSLSPEQMERYESLILYQQWHKLLDEKQPLRTKVFEYDQQPIISVVDDAAPDTEELTNYIQSQFSAMPEVYKKNYVSTIYHKLYSMLTIIHDNRNSLDYEVYRTIDLSTLTMLLQLYHSPEMTKAFSDYEHSQIEDPALSILLSTISVNIQADYPIYTNSKDSEKFIEVSKQKEKVARCRCLTNQVAVYQAFLKYDSDKEASKLSSAMHKKFMFTYLDSILDEFKYINPDNKRRGELHIVHNNYKTMMSNLMSDPALRLSPFSNDKLGGSLSKNTDLSITEENYERLHKMALVYRATQSPNDEMHYELIKLFDAVLISLRDELIEQFPEQTLNDIISINKGDELVEIYLRISENVTQSSITGMIDLLKDTDGRLDEEQLQTYNTILSSYLQLPDDDFNQPQSILNYRFKRAESLFNENPYHCIEQLRGIALAAEDSELTDYIHPMFINSVNSVEEQGDYLYSCCIASNDLLSKLVYFIDNLKSNTDGMSAPDPYSFIVPDEGLLLLLSEEQAKQLLYKIDLLDNDKYSFKQALQKILKCHIKSLSQISDNPDIITRDQLNNINDIMIDAWRQRRQEVILNQFAHPEAMADSVVDDSILSILGNNKEQFTAFCNELLDKVRPKNTLNIEHIVDLSSPDDQINEGEGIETNVFQIPSLFLSQTALTDLETLLSLDSSDENKTLVKDVAEEIAHQLINFLHSEEVQQLPLFEFEQKILSRLNKGDPPFNAAIDMVQGYADSSLKSKLRAALRINLTANVKDSKLSLVDEMLRCSSYRSLYGRLSDPEKTIARGRNLDFYYSILKYRLQDDLPNDDILAKKIKELSRLETIDDSIANYLNVVMLVADPTRLTQLTELLLSRDSIKSMKHARQSLNDLEVALSELIKKHTDAPGVSELVALHDDIKTNLQGDVDEKSLNAIFLRINYLKTQLIFDHSNIPLSNTLDELLSLCTFTTEKLQFVHSLVSTNWFSLQYQFITEDKQIVPLYVFDSAYKKERWYTDKKLHSGINLKTFLDVRRQLYEGLLSLSGESKAELFQKYQQMLFNIAKKNLILKYDKSTNKYQEVAVDEQPWCDFLQEMDKLNGAKSLLKDQGIGTMQALFDLYNANVSSQLATDNTIRQQFSSSESGSTSADLNLTMIHLESVFLTSRVTLPYEQAYMPDDTDLPLLKKIFLQQQQKEREVEEKLEALNAINSKTPSQMQELITLQKEIQAEKMLTSNLFMKYKLRYKDCLNNHKQLLSKSIHAILSSANFPLIYRVENLLQQWVVSYNRQFNIKLMQMIEGDDVTLLSDGNVTVVDVQQRINNIDKLSSTDPYQALQLMKALQSDLNAEKIAEINDKYFAYGYELFTLADTMKKQFATQHIPGYQDYLDNKDIPKPNALIIDTGIHNTDKTLVQSGAMYPSPPTLGGAE